MDHARGVEPTQRLTPGLAGYVGLIILGLVLRQVAVLGYLTIALLLIVPIGLRRAHQAEAGGPSTLRT